MRLEKAAGRRCRRGSAEREDVECAVHSSVSLGPSWRARPEWDGVGAVASVNGGIVLLRFESSTKCSSASPPRACARRAVGVRNLSTNFGHERQDDAGIDGPNLSAVDVVCDGLAWSGRHVAVDQPVLKDRLEQERRRGPRMVFPTLLDYSACA